MTNGYICTYTVSHDQGKSRISPVLERYGGVARCLGATDGPDTRHRAARRRDMSIAEVPGCGDSLGAIGQLTLAQLRRRT